MDNSYTNLAPQIPGDITSGPDLIAIGLLKLQQRFDALDRLYNEEISALCQELARLKADYVRLCQNSAPQPIKAKRSRGQASRTTQNL